MQTLLRTVFVTLATAAPALAANGSEMKGISLLLILFLGFAALIIVFQFIPGMVLLVSMLKGLFTQSQKKAAETVSGKHEEK